VTAAPRLQGTSQIAVISCVSVRFHDRSATALRCAVLGSLQTAIEDARVRRSQGEIDDSAYAAVLYTVPNALSWLRRNPQTGVRSDVWSIQAAITTSSPHISFDPHAGDFAAAMQRASSPPEGASSSSTGRGHDRTTYRHRQR